MRNMLRNLQKQHAIINFRTTYAALALSTSATHNNEPAGAKKLNERKMGAWQIHAYDDDLQYSDKTKIPTITGANDVLVKVSAASVNPIDIAMSKGYGASIFNALRSTCSSSDCIEFPLTLGRDFAGEIVHKGMAVRQELQLGQRVCGVVPLHRPGSHAEFVTVDAYNVTSTPGDLSDTDAAAVLYAGLTAWSGLFVSGQLGGITGATTSLGGGQGKRVCVLGASGGVGNVAVQISKAEGCEIVATCATDAVPLINGLGVHHVVDYTCPRAAETLASLGPYDIVLDCAGKGGDHANELPWKYNHYVTFSSPMLRNFDQYGLAGGSVRNAMNLIENNFRSLSQSAGLVKWAYFLPAPHAIEYLMKLVERKKLLPIVEQIYEFKETNQAYKRVADGHLRGKIVVKL